MLAADLLADLLADPGRIRMRAGTNERYPFSLSRAARITQIGGMTSEPVKAVEPSGPYAIRIRIVMALTY
jgi:hypothetical protein